MIARLLGLLVLVGAAAGQDEADAQARAAVDGFLAALKRCDAPGAVALCWDAGNPELRMEAERKWGRMAPEMSSGAWALTVLEARADEDMGIVIVNESTKGGKPAMDIDALYVIRHDERWQVLAEAPDDPRYALDADARARFRALTTWFEGRERDLTAAMRAAARAPVP